MKNSKKNVAISNVLATPGISKQGQTLLTFECDKCWTLLQYHLQLERGDFYAAEKRCSELSRLIKFILYVANVSIKFMYVVYLINPFMTKSQAGIIGYK